MRGRDFKRKRRFGAEEQPPSPFEEGRPLPPSVKEELEREGVGGGEVYYAFEEKEELAAIRQVLGRETGPFLRAVGVTICRRLKNGELVNCSKGFLQRLKKTEDNWFLTFGIRGHFLLFEGEGHSLVIKEGWGSMEKYEINGIYSAPPDLWQIYFEDGKIMNL